MGANRGAKGAGRCVGLALAALLASACASSPPPREFDLRQLRLVVVATPPRLDVNGLPGGKAVGAGVGAGTGSGAGVVVGAVACLATGPFFPLCVASVVPAGALVGAVAGGVVGAVKTESSDAIALKTQVLRDELIATPYPQQLAQRLREALHAERAIDLPVDVEPSAAGAPGAAAPWTLEVAVTEVGTEGKSEFALRLVTRIALRRGDAAAPVWTVAKEVQSETELTTAAWTTDDARALHAVLDRCLAQAAHELLIDLTRPFDRPAGVAHPVSRYSSSCKDVPAEVTAPRPAPAPSESS